MIKSLFTNFLKNVIIKRAHKHLFILPLTLNLGPGCGSSCEPMHVVHALANPDRSEQLRLSLDHGPTSHGCNRAV